MNLIKGFVKVVNYVIINYSERIFVSLGISIMVLIARKFFYENFHFCRLKLCDNYGKLKH